MIKTILFIVLGLAVLAVAIVLLLAVRQPDTFRVERAARIAAPPERIFPLINDMRQMNAWNPFVKKDPNLKGSYSGPASGPGAAYSFEGNKEVGSGSLRIVGATVPTSVAMKLDMTAPMKANNDILFSLVPEGQATRVTWSMEGPCPYLGKVMGVIFNMDKMVGGTFETGLADLKAKAERA
jgi:carbon monoxide dehydrogenase subunit G